MSTDYRAFLCAAFRNDRAALQAALQQPDWNWESLIQAASQEAVLPALHALHLPALPPHIADFLLAVETANRERNQAIFDELKAAVAQLNGIGIEPVLLKGLAYLTTAAYRDPAHRFLMDIDLLVPEEQLKPAVDALTQNGWTPDNLDPFRNFRHHDSPLRRPSKVWIELHRDVGMGDCARVLPAKDVIARSTKLDLNGLHVRVPAPEDQLAHLILHSQMQHSTYNRIWAPMRCMVDLLHLNRRFGTDLRWESVANRFSAAGKYGIFALHLKQVQDALGLPPQLHLAWNPFLQFSWKRRKLLQQHPKLRYFDPAYMFSIALSHRLTTLRKVLETPNGIRYILSHALAPGNYLQLWTDLVEGRGR